MPTPHPLYLRLMTKSDEPFVHSSFFMTVARATNNYHMKREVFERCMDERINRLLARSRTLIAFFADVPDEILGYSVIEDRALHMVYVKVPYRGMGIGSGLVKGAADVYTHRVGRFPEKMGLEYQPFILEGIK